MLNIAVIIADQFEDIEYSEPAKAFEAAGHRLTHIGINRGETVVGKKHGTRVTIDTAVDTVTVADYDALLIPGGYSPDRLRADENAVAFAKAFLDSGKPVFAICHGPQLLISAQALQGRKVTGWKSIVQDIKNAGAEFVDRDVVEDGNLISSRGPDDIPAFIDAALRKLGAPWHREESFDQRRVTIGI
jgi:protease I